MNTAFFTICARNYLAYALTLRESLVTSQPDARLYIFLADDPLPAEHDLHDCIPIADVTIPDFAAMTFQYTLMEFSTAVKPFCFRHLFDILEYDAAIFLDPDIQIFRPLDEVVALLEGGASAALTPHLLQPLQDASKPDDLDILRSGTFNLGFIALSRQPEALRFLAWWAGQMRTQCRVDLPRGLFVDQKFVDFAPSFLENLEVLRHPGYNVAYWNLAHRPVEFNESGWTAAGADLVFFHFSGVVPGDPGVLSRHQNRFDMHNSGGAARLVTAYLDRLDANGQRRWSLTPYAFDSFTDGTLIPSAMRRAPVGQSGSPSKFDQPAWDFWNGPSERVDQAERRTFTRLMFAIHAGREDLGEAFPLATASGRAGFHDWFVSHGAQECRVPAHALAAAMAGPGGRDRSAAWSASIRRFGRRLLRR